jgi:hypothetical protein
MGPLANQRHERFAQALAQGKTATEAYALAGYRANDGNASRLKMQAIVFAFTTTSFILGPDGEQALKVRLEKRSNGRRQPS